MRQQVWSLEAHQRVEAVARTEAAGEYRTIAMKAPVLLQQSGVMQTLAFLLSRKATGEKWCEDLAGIYGRPDARALLAEAQKAPMAEYLRLSEELIDVAVWMRRFAQICIEPAAERKD